MSELTKVKKQIILNAFKWNKGNIFPVPTYILLGEKNISSILMEMLKERYIEIRGSCYFVTEVGKNLKEIQNELDE